MSFLLKFKEALSKTHQKLSSKLRSLLGSPLDEAQLEKLEALLFESDLGRVATEKILKELKAAAKKKGTLSEEESLSILENSLLEILSTVPDHPKVATEGPQVWLIIGVNGSGKTTSVAKLAARAISEGKRVMVAACDTFRAAASEQLALWSERVGFTLIQGKPQADPAALAFDALTSAKAKGFDLLIIDTAGRLESKSSLLDELAKVRRVLAKLDPLAPHETLLVLDATLGQAALEQVRRFHEKTPLSALIMTKLDGSAKGGVLVPIILETRLPIRFIGKGEGANDLFPFEAKSYVEALLR